DLADRKYRLQVEHRSNLLSLHDRASYLDRHAVDDAVEGCAHYGAVELGLGRFELRLRLGKRRTRLVELQLGEIAALGQPLGSFQLCPALLQRLTRALDRSLLAFRLEAHD